MSESASAGRQIVRVGFFGLSTVGKTALISQKLNSSFIRHYDPTIEERFRTDIVFQGRHYSLDLLDASGDSEWESMTTEWYEGTDVFVLVCSLADPASLRNLPVIRDRILAVTKTPRFPGIIVANKNDLPADELLVSRSEVESLAADFFPALRGSARAVRMIYATATDKSSADSVFEAALSELVRESFDVTTVAARMEGWLLKDGGGFMKSAQRRWFVLDGAAMLYFKDPPEVASAAAAVGVLDLRDARASVDGKNLHLFGPTLNAKKAGKGYTLGAKDDAEAQRWADAVNAIAADAR